MSNVLTDLAGDIYKAADVIGREQVGFIPSITINGSGSERAAVGDIIRSHFTRVSAAVDNTPAMTIPEGTDQTVDNKTMTISKSKGVQIPWTGEDIKSVDNGSGFDTIYGDQIVQAMRTLTNLIEIDCAIAAYLAASRQYGTAGTTPFAALADAPQVRKILVDNGCAMTDVSLIVDSTAGVALRSLVNLTDVDRSGDETLLRQGILLPLSDMNLRESAKVQTHTKGTGTSYQTNLIAGYDIGDTAIAIDTGSGTILAGDTITFAGDTNKYVAQIVGTTTLVTLQEPGLREALADNVVMTIGNAAVQNVALERSAFELAIRAPAKPNGGDAAVDQMLVQDPRSGLAFDVSVYKGFQKSMVNVSAAWGVKAWKPENIAGLLG